MALWPVSLLDELHAEAALLGVHTLADLGVLSITAWTLTATCSWHGVQSVVLEESTDVPDRDAFIQCFGCAARAVTRWLPIEGCEPT